MNSVHNLIHILLSQLKIVNIVMNNKSFFHVLGTVKSVMYHIIGGGGNKVYHLKAFEKDNSLKYNRSNFY